MGESFSPVPHDDAPIESAVFTLGAIAIPHAVEDPTERARGIGPPSQAWEACVLPLNHARASRFPARGPGTTAPF